MIAQLQPQPPEDEEQQAINDRVARLKQQQLKEIPDYLTVKDVQTVNEQLVRDLNRNPASALNSADAILVLKNEQCYYRRVRRGKGDKFKVLSPETLSYVFSSGKVDSGWIPEGIVRCGSSIKGYWAIYFIPATKYTILIEGISSIELPLPSFVWITIEQESYLVAVKKSQFSPNLVCFHAPLPNVYGTGFYSRTAGNVCWGENNPELLTEGELQTVVKNFKLFTTGAIFNNHLISYKSRTHPTDIRMKLQTVAQQNLSRYPLKDLLPIDSDMTVAEYFDYLINKR